MQVERKRQAGALLETLKELCAALEIRPDSVEQRSCISLMESAACVHVTSLEKACTQAPRWPATCVQSLRLPLRLVVEIWPRSGLFETLEDWNARRASFSPCCQGMQRVA